MDENVDVTEQFFRNADVLVLVCSSIEEDCDFVNILDWREISLFDGRVDDSPYQAYEYHGNDFNNFNQKMEEHVDPFLDTFFPSCKGIKVFR